jgi:predicted DNA-binding protein
MSDTKRRDRRLSVRISSNGDEAIQALVDATGLTEAAVIRALLGVGLSHELEVRKRLSTVGEL